MPGLYVTENWDLFHSKGNLTGFHLRPIILLQLNSFTNGMKMKTVHCCEEESFDNKISLTPQLSGADRRNCSQIKAYLIFFNFKASTPPQLCSFSNGMHMKKGKKQIFSYIMLLHQRHHKAPGVWKLLLSMPQLPASSKDNQTYLSEY